MARIQSKCELEACLVAQVENVLEVTAPERQYAMGAEIEKHIIPTLEVAENGNTIIRTDFVVIPTEEFRKLLKCAETLQGGFTVREITRILKTHG